MCGDMLGDSLEGLFGGMRGDMLGDTFEDLFGGLNRPTGTNYNKTKVTKTVLKICRRKLPVALTLKIPVDSLVTCLVTSSMTSLETTTTRNTTLFGNNALGPSEST